MTVNSSDGISGPYSGNGSTTSFAVTFEFAAEGDIQVILADSDLVETVQTITTHYTVTGGAGSTGTVEMVTAPASGETLTILRDLDFTQEVDYTEVDPFPAETHEGALDKLTYLIQQVKEVVDRCMYVSASSGASGAIDMTNFAAGVALVVNADGDGFEFTEQSIADLEDDAADAAASAASAAASATAAATSESNAADSATAAQDAVDTISLAGMNIFLSSNYT